MPRSANGLTDKQSAFVAEYLKDLNATQAAIRAGYSAKTANRIAAENLAKPVIVEALQAAMTKRAEAVEVSAADVLREIKLLAFSDVRHFAVGEDGELVLAPEAPDAAWRAVSSVKHKIRRFTDKEGNTEVNREIEYRLWDKNAALEKAAKHIRFYPPEKIEHTGEGGGPVHVSVTHRIVDP